MASILDRLEVTIVTYQDVRVFNLTTRSQHHPHSHPHSPWQTWMENSTETLTAETFFKLEHPTLVLASPSTHCCTLGYDGDVSVTSEWCPISGVECNQQWRGAHSAVQKLLGLTISSQAPGAAQQLDVAQGEQLVMRLLLIAQVYPVQYPRAHFSPLHPSHPKQPSSHMPMDHRNCPRWH